MTIHRGVIVPQFQIEYELVKQNHTCLKTVENRALKQLFNVKHNLLWHLSNLGPKENPNSITI